MDSVLQDKLFVCKLIGVQSFSRKRCIGIFSRPYKQAEFEIIFGEEVSKLVSTL